MFRRVFTLVSFIALGTACESSYGGFVGVQPGGTKLVFLTQPSNVQANQPISPLVQIAVQNVNNQTVNNSTANVTLTIAPSTGASGALLTGGTAQTALNGIVNFNNLRIDLTGSGYQLVAAAQGFPAVTSATFNVTP